MIRLFNWQESRRQWVSSRSDLYLNRAQTLGVAMNYCVYKLQLTSLPAFSMPMKSSAYDPKEWESECKSHSAVCEYKLLLAIF
jgi:hypothetical protein